METVIEELLFLNRRKIKCFSHRRSNALSKFSTDLADNNLIYSSIMDEEIWDIHWIAGTNSIVLHDGDYFIYNSNFVHRFCLCTMKIQYLADIQLSKSRLLGSVPPEVVFRKTDRGLIDASTSSLISSLMD